ncbi:MAG: acyl-CoA thioesterase domain-containing protein [Cellvibrionaceae bacterium]
MLSETEDYFFNQDDDVFTPQAAAGSPWSNTMQHGGPVNAMITMPIEKIAEEICMDVTRLTIDILKPVPMKPVKVKSHFLRKGGKMAVVDTVMTVEGSDEPVASGRAVLLKAQQGLSPVFDVAASLPETRDSIASEPWIPKEMAAGLPPGLHNLIRFHPSTNKERPVFWINGDANMLQGRAMTSLEQCATTADMTTVLAARMRVLQEGIASPAAMGLMNTNTTIHFSRPPVGEWFAFTDHFIEVTDGYGIAECAIYDEQGCIGRVAQNLIVNG